MIIVTGAAGFIGSNLIKGLNQAGYRNILAVDDLTDGHKFSNLACCEYRDYIDYVDFLNGLENNSAPFKSADVIFHQGACSITTEWNGRYMMKNNYDYSKTLLHFCLDNQVPFIYASSAAVYGAKQQFDENSTQQLPLNVYGYSKWLFDQYMLQYLTQAKSQIVGLRYFNVYGPHEAHKGNMASVAFHFMNQLEKGNEVKLFEGSHGYGNGEQRRDFIYVNDVVKINLWFMGHRQKSGIFNVGTGQARSFNDLAKSLIQLHGRGVISYIPFPEKLKTAYQAFTQADITKLRAAGYEENFISLEEGLLHYYEYMNKKSPHYE